jgi:Trypsin-co-occurring domain 2
VDEGAAVGLAEAIEQVRSELARAQAEGADKELRFRLGDVQLEFSVGLAKEGGGEAGVKLWVVSVGASGSVSSTRTHTVTVSMVPQLRSSDGSYRDAYVGDELTTRPPAPHSAS